MWVGSIRLRVRTKDAPNAGTDNLVRATVVRDGRELVSLLLDYVDEDDLERGALRDYNYISSLPRINDATPQLPDGIGQDPMPYPSYGIEFSHGLHGHLRLRLNIGGDDMWIKDNVDLDVREIQVRNTSFDTVAWQEDSTWTYLGTWSQDVTLSTDFFEGFSTWDLALT